jgi:hypothetical protein
LKAIKAVIPSKRIKRRILYLRIDWPRLFHILLTLIKTGAKKQKND